ncbi:heme peroxidase, partial [Russula earlei]
TNTALYVTVGLALVGGLSYHVYSSLDTAATTVKSGMQSAKSALKFTPTKVYNKIAQKFDNAGDYDDGCFGPVLLCLTWHSAGTYDNETKTGGSNYATMHFTPESLNDANNGLPIACAIMEWISYSNLWTLAGVAAIQQETGGPKIPWRPGCIDGFAKDVTPDGHLPDAYQGQDHLHTIFYCMGYN